VQAPGEWEDKTVLFIHTGGLLGMYGKAVAAPTNVWQVEQDGLVTRMEKKRQLIC